MAMRLFSAEEFRNELGRRGCERIADAGELGSVWRGPNGRHFLVPRSEETGGRYPDWMLDHLISRLKLPPAPTND